ncbi:Putative AC transposase [Linum grandiflorum]
MQSNSSQSDAISPSVNSSNTPPTSDSATAVPPTIVPQGQGQGQGADSSDNPPVATDTNSQGTNASEGETGATGGRKTSLAWLHFTKVKSPGGEVVKAQCTYCKKLLVAGSKNGTTHLNEHYKRYHKNVRDIRQQVLIKNISGQMSQKSVHNFSEEAARLALACMIVLHEYPLAIVDHFYFRKFLHIIQPLFKCPTRNTVKSDILKMYKSELENLRNVLEDIDSRVAITSDMFCYVPCPHTAEALAAAIYKVLFEWNLDRKLSTMAVKMIEKFDKYWSVIHNVLSMAAVLDPRYKMALLNFYFPLVYGTNSSSELFKVRKLLEDLVNDYKDKSAGKEDAMPIDDNSSSEVTGGRMTEYDKFVDILLASSDSGKNELDTYLEDKVLRRSVDFDILNWWKANSTKYPTLSLITRDVLVIPISTVASESAFSAGGRLISAQRSRLHVKTVEALMCTQSWLLDQVEKEDLSELPSDTTATANDDEDPAFIDVMAGNVF